MSSDKPAVRLALLGCGTVGTEVVRLLHEQAEDLTARIGAPLELVGIAVRRPGRQRKKTSTLAARLLFCARRPRKKGAAPHDLSVLERVRC